MSFVARFLQSAPAARRAYSSVCSSSLKSAGGRYSTQDYKLHQFFSLHRPLLLLSQPASAIFESPLFTPNVFASTVVQPKLLQTRTLDDPPESSPGSEADIARQFAHTLVMNRVGSVISWQDTLSRLGLDKDVPVERLALAKEWAKEWDTVHADSTKRKRRKKMKKHKLKKRRRLQRAQRLQGGH